MIDSFGFTTTMIARAVRERSLLPLEEAVHLVTGRPAALYGLRDRGELRPGAWADIVVFDASAIDPEPATTRNDLPGGAGRLYGGASGITHVFVAGTEVVTSGRFTGNTPGRILRSGRDTGTVTAAVPWR